MKIEVAIIGAGPGGLCAAYYLNKAGIKNVVLEKDIVGSSWLNMPDFFKLVTPNWTNKLPGRPSVSFLKTPSCNEYGRYLREYADQNSITVQEHTECFNIEHNPHGGYRVEHSNGHLECDKIVFACGYFSKPKRPPELATATDDNLIHSSEIKSLADISAAQRLLIVGKRESAGQIAGAFLSGTHGSVTLSFDGELALRRNHTLLGKLREKIYFFYEPVKCALGRNKLTDSFPPMDTAHIHTHLKSNRLHFKPRISAWDGAKATFKDGATEHYDLVVLATGYEYTLPTPSSSALSKKGNEIATIGRDHQIDFRSRYLRGLRRDAKLITNELIRA